MKKYNNGTTDAIVRKDKICSFNSAELLISDLLHYFTLVTRSINNPKNSRKYKLEEIKRFGKHKKKELVFLLQNP